MCPKPALDRRGNARIRGCIAIVEASPAEAQLRWFRVAPEARGRGLGRRLLHDAIEFCRTCGYQSIFLWTVSAQESAARLYRAAGFERVQQRPGRLWGFDLVEDR